jgi:amidase
MQTIGTDVLYFETGPDNAPTARVEPGEPFTVLTQLNRGAWLKALPLAERADLERRLLGDNPASGCIAVTGVRAGDMLSLEIGAIELEHVGFTRFRGCNDATPRSLRLALLEKTVEIRDGSVVWSDTLRLPARPMLGFMAVSPARERLLNTTAGTWGGNMDAQELGTGATLHLKAQCDDALLHVGDMHAIQGDGEICGAGGTEASGRVELSCRVSSPAPTSLHWPRFENETHIGVIAQARPAEDAFRHALADLIGWLEDDYEMSPGDAYLLLGQVLESRIVAYVNPTFSSVAKIARDYLP